MQPETSIPANAHADRSSGSDFDQIRQLRNDNAWEEILELTDPWLPRLRGLAALARIEALRATDREQEALQLVLTQEAPEENSTAGKGPGNEEFDLLQQSGSILCEAGHFERALQILRPATTPVSNVHHRLLNLRGWAHQNCLNATHAEEGAACYRAALENLERAAAREPGKDQQAASEKLGLWYRKGLGNALRRIPEKREEARGTYQTLLDKLEGADPFAQRIKGWCFYKLGELQRALDAYKAALDAGLPRFSAQLDYALILFAMRRYLASDQQYQAAVLDLRDLGAVRRCGILRVSFFELCDAISEEPELWTPQAHGLVKFLFGELEQTVGSLSAGLSEAGNEILKAAAEVRNALPSHLTTGLQTSADAPKVLRWDATEIVGFLYANFVPCGIFPPVLREGDSESLQVIENGQLTGASDGSTITIRTLKTGERVCFYPFKRPASPTAAVLYVEQQYFSFADSDQASLPGASSLEWIRVSEPMSGSVACTTVDQAKYILERIARNLNSGVVWSIAASNPHSSLIDRARMAVFAAADETTLYQAALCTLIAGGHKDELETLSRDAPRLTVPPDLESAAERFRRNVLLLGPDPLRSSDGSVVEGILARAEAITNSPDEKSRELEAIRAAAEMQLCLPETPELTAVQERVAQRLSRCDALYLETDDEILALSREPAFFCSMAKPKLSKPALDAFGFFSAPAKYSSLRDGPIAIKAKAAVSRTMEPGPADLVTVSGGLGKAVHTIVSIMRALWRIVLQDEGVPAAQAGSARKQRRTSYERLFDEYRKLANEPIPKAFDAVLDCLIQKHLCWRNGDEITYRPSVMNALDLCRILLEGVRPDHDLRYFAWRDVRRYYGFAQSPEVAHNIHALSTALNDLISSRREAGLVHGHMRGVTWELGEDILPLIHNRISRNFVIPVKMSEFFLECCRFVNYIQLSTDIGRVEIRALEIDAEYLLSQLYGVPTGIKGLDDLFGGGGIMLVEGDTSSGTAHLGGRTVLTVGPFGTGKSLLTLQMAVEVARKGGVAWVMALEQSAEECLYTLEAMGRLPDDIPIRIANSVPKAIEVLENPEEDKGALILVRTIKDTFEDFIVTFEQNAKLMSRYPLRLIAVDPVSAISQGELRGTHLRSEILRLFEAVKRQGTNIWLVSEERTGDEPVVEQNIADTVIHLKYENAQGYSQRYFEITKSRLQREHRGAHAFAIGPGRGITIYPSSSAVRSRIQKRTSRPPDTPISFGVPSIDELLGKDGLYAGDVIVLHGSSGSGMARVNLAFLLGADLPGSEKEKKEATSMLVTRAEVALSVRDKLHQLYESMASGSEFVRAPHRVRIVGIPGGYVKPGFILQQIEDEFEQARITRKPIVRVSVDSVAAWELGCPFVRADHTFGETLVELLRKHRTTSLFVCNNVSGQRGSVLQQSIVNSSDCLINFQTLPVKGTPEPHFGIEKTRTMRHRRGTFRLQLDSSDASATTTLMRVVRPGEVRPIKIRLFLHAESDMQTAYNQAILMAVRGVLSRDADIAEESPIHFSRALELGAASALDELQVIQLDEYQVPSTQETASALYRFDVKQWSSSEWDDFLPSVRNRIQSGDSFTAVPFYDNISMLAWRGNLDERSRQSWRGLADTCELWEREHPHRNELFFDFPAVTGENYNCLFLEILRSLEPVPENFVAGCGLLEWLSSDAAAEASFLFRKLCYRTYAHRPETLQQTLVKAAPFTANSKAQVWRHWYTTLNQMLSGMSREERSTIRVGPLPGGVSTAGEWYLGVPAYSAAPDVGLKLIKLFTTHEAESDRLRLGVGLPTRESFYVGSPGRSSISPLFAMDADVLRELVNTAFRRSSFGCYSKFSTLLTVYLQDLMEHVAENEEELKAGIRSRLSDLLQRLDAIRVDGCPLCTSKKRKSQGLDRPF